MSMLLVPGPDFEKPGSRAEVNKLWPTGQMQFTTWFYKQVSLEQPLICLKNITYALQIQG